MDCYKCPYKQLCHDLPSDMSCDDVLNYARDGEAKEAYIDARAEAKTMPTAIPASEESEHD